MKVSEKIKRIPTKLDVKELKTTKQNKNTPQNPPVNKLTGAYSNFQGLCIFFTPIHPFQRRGWHYKTILFHTTPSNWTEEYLSKPTL